MSSVRLRIALLGAGATLAALALPGAATAAPPASSFARGEVVVERGDGVTKVVAVPAGASISRRIAELRRRPGVRSASRNWIVRAASAPLDQGSAGTPGGWTAEQWSFGPKPGGIRAQAAWDRVAAANAPGGLGVTVAVVDSGIAYEDAPGYAASPDFTPARFVPGIDLVDDDGQPLDENGHGTHVAGTIGEQVTLGAPASGPDYLTGIAYNALLMPVRVLDRDGVGTTDDVAAGILWAARNGADLINVSLNLDPAVTGCHQVPAVCTAIRKATRLGALVIGAAGNAPTGAAGTSHALFPAAAPRAFAVAATTEDGCLASYSQYGKHTDLLAPGGGTPRPAAARPICKDDSLPVVQLTYACFPMDCSGAHQQFGIRPDVGTSMSAAHTTGVAALVLASGRLGPDPDPDLLAQWLRCTARPSTPQRFYGVGALDARRAVGPKRGCDTT